MVMLPNDPPVLSAAMLAEWLPDIIVDAIHQAVHVAGVYPGGGGSGPSTPGSAASMAGRNVTMSLGTVEGDVPLGARFASVLLDEEIQQDSFIPVTTSAQLLTDVSGGDRVLVLYGNDGSAFVVGSRKPGGGKGTADDDVESGTILSYDPVTSIAVVQLDNGDIVSMLVIGGTGADVDSSLVDEIVQTAHGLAVGDVIRLSGTSYIKAKADNAADAEVVGVVSAVADADHFTFTTDGYISGLTGLTAGVAYFLSPTTAGGITATEPSTVGQISKPVLIAATTTSGYVVTMRGIAISAGSTNYWAFASHQLAFDSTNTSGITDFLASVNGTNSLELKDDGSVGPTHQFAKLLGTYVTVSAGSTLTLSATSTATLTAAANVTVSATGGNDVATTGRDVTQSATRNAFLLGAGIEIGAGSTGTIVGTITGANPCVIEANPIVFGTKVYFDGLVSATGPVGSVVGKIPVYAGDGSTISGYLPLYGSIT